MNKKFTPYRYFYLAMAVLLFASLAFSISAPSPASAIDLTDENAMKRADMMAIAERYLNYEWTAVNDHWREMDDGTEPPHYHNDRHSNNVDTPDINWCNDPWGCWDVSPTVNVGVPYFWGGSTAVEDDPDDSIPDLNLDPQDYMWPAGGLPAVGYFGEKIAAGAPAGDVNTTAIGGPANGVDCVGFIGQVWRQGVRFGMSRTREVSRPIKFKDLRAGDIVLRYTGDGYDHVILFKEFLNYNPQNGLPVPGVTRFTVYEAALGPHKVVQSEYLLTEMVNEQQYFLNTNHNTDKVKIKRLRYCDPNSCKDDGVYELGNYYPRTYFTPIDVSLVIDRSGSMSWEYRMLQAQLAASMFVDFMRPWDKIGVVAFNETATVYYPLHSISYSGFEQGVAKNVINSLYASGNTSIGGGLQAGYQDLITNGVNASTGEADPVRLMLLLSDGWETSPPFVTDDLLNNIKSADIVVHTLGIGSGADQELLTNIASQTGGSYYYATADGLRSIFNYLMVKVYGESVVRSVSRTVSSGATVEENVSVDSTMGSMTVSLLWPGSDLDLTLVRPDGSVINPTVAESDPKITFTSGSTYEFYKIQKPQPGTWKMRVFGKTTSSPEEEYTIITSTRDALLISVDVDKSEYFAGQPIKLTASIEDSFSASPTSPEYIYGATMLVTAEDPALGQYTFELYDDGQHGDGDADDGVYANTFSNTSLPGSYNFNVQISGINNRDGQPFTREHHLSQVVSERTSQDVVIDIKPGSDPNSVNCKNDNGVITVAVLTTDTFDALTIDATTVTFEGAGEIHADKNTGEPQRHEEDVDKDGDIDLVFHFRLGNTNLACSSTEGVLTGATYGGLRIIGTDSIRMIKK